MQGAFNATAPTPVTNAQFSRAVGRVLDRPSWMPTPGFVVRLVLGEMGDALLLGGQRVVPARAAAAGFTFRFSDLDAALGDLYKDKR
jgi:NAD dependent epimerase/dehydratase family enzyme